MSVATLSSNQLVILRDVSWGLYEKLLAEVGESSPGMRVTFDKGALQIMVVSLGHDQPNRTLEVLIEAVAEETAVDCCPAGSTTFQRPDLLKGFEPDSSFYFRHAARMRPKDEINLLVDPAPELVIEIDITRNSLDRFPLFAAVGVAEVWRYKDGVVTMHALRDGAYEPIERSLALPVLDARTATRFVDESRSTPRPEWLKRIRNWVREQTGSKSF